MIKKLMLLFLLLFSYNNVSALELCSPSKEYLDYMSLPLEERVNYQKPIYCSSVFNNDLSNSFSSTGTISQNILVQTENSISSSFYNAYNDGIVNQSGNQYHTGLCWDFSALSVVETNAMKNNVGSFDFSEIHLAYSILGNVYVDAAGQRNKYNYGGRDGGKITFAPTYFFNNNGQFLETEMPFVDSLNLERTNLKKINSADYTSGNNYISVETYKLDNLSDDGICTVNDIETIKDNILKYGSVQATMYMDESLFADSNFKYYRSSLNNSIGPNHGVVLVGWDDSISKNLFNGATRDGAWIVKNSWGSTWGGNHNGLFYISYDDDFICKGIASFYGVSNKSFDYTYKAADLMGNLVLAFTDEFYFSSRFTKQSSDIETIDRISFPTSEDIEYSIYLSKDNDLNNKDNWILLKTGSSNNYGIDSVNLEGIEVDNDFTIIVKYNYLVINDRTSLLTMCNNDPDYNDLDISVNTNYFSYEGNYWRDFSSINTDKGVIGCEPNIYVYTNKKTTTPKLEINAISNINDDINLTITKKNISNSDVSYKILDEHGIDVTSHFTITPHYDYSNVNIVSDNTISGTFTVTMSNNNTNVSNTFKLVEDVSSINKNMVVNDNKIVVVIGKGKTLTYKDITDSLKLKNTTIRVTDSKGNQVNSNTSAVGTSSTINTNNNSYKVIIKGDPTGDGKISALDYIAIRKHIIKSGLITDPMIKAAADMDNNDKISALDYIAIRKIMIGG